jgi:hypothetical protein
MANSREPYVLMTLYQNLYIEKYKKPATLNKFREKWAMQDVIDSVGLDKAIDLMNYYFSLEKFGHPLQFFYYNFDKMENARNELQKDIETRRRLRENTKKMVEEGGL